MGLFRNFRNFKRRRRRIRQLKKAHPRMPVRLPDGTARKPMHFNASATPEVSIVIPFHNQFNYTWNCLLHLHAHLHATVTFELILIDDTSTESCDFSAISGIRIIRNENNLGFLKSINRGIREAKGEFVYILNNDTEVREGFLEELVNVFKRFPNAGAAGSKLLNADGSLQEAGCVFMKDCTIHQVVAKREPYYPQVNFVYKVDYCSGCSLLFHRRKDNSELNLFDEQFAPAYFEETDFCFQLKHLQNKEVYYCPFSEVLHFNGVSYNATVTDVNEDKAKKKEALFNANLVKFKNKWQQQIDAIQATTVEARIEELYGNKSVVIFCAVIPEHDRDSGSNRLKEIIDAYIETGYYVLMIKNKTYRPDGKYIAYYERAGVNVFYEHDMKTGPGEYLEKNLTRPAIAWFYNPDVFEEYYPMAKAHLPAGSKMVFDMVDVHHLRYKRAAELEPANIKFQKHYERYARIEAAAAGDADYVITISDFEKNYMSQFCAPEKIITISNIHYIKTALEKSVPFEAREGILFIGSSHTPNIDALYFLFNDIMPLVWNQLPGLKVNVIGNVKECIEDIQHPDFIFHGYVPDVEPQFLRNKLMVAPLRYGAGVKGKIGQAFEYYLPLVTSSIGAEGMQLTQSENALIQDDAAGFADAIIQLYSDKSLWLKLQGNSEKSLYPFSKKNLKSQLLKIS